MKITIEAADLNDKELVNIADSLSRNIDELAAKIGGPYADVPAMESTFMQLVRAYEDRGGDRTDIRCPQY